MPDRPTVTDPAHNGFYYELLSDRLYRFDGNPENEAHRLHAWSQVTSDSWRVCAAPQYPVEVLSGTAVLVLGLPEPDRVGAVVREADCGSVWIRHADGSWHGPRGTLAWADLRHPVVLAPGVKL